MFIKSMKKEEQSNSRLALIFGRGVGGMTAVLMETHVSEFHPHCEHPSLDQEMSVVSIASVPSHTAKVLRSWDQAGSHTGRS